MADVSREIRSYCIQNLRDDSEYMFRVAAENPVGRSVATVTAEPLVLKRPQEPPNPPKAPFEISGMSSASLTLKWGVPDKNDNPIAYYVLEKREVIYFLLGIGNYEIYEKQKQFIYF